MKYTKNIYKQGKLEDYSQIILVSKSPRRIQLIKKIADAQSISTDIDERKIEQQAYQKYKDKPLFEKFALSCCEISKAKIAPLKLQKNTLYIASDTIVINDSKILNKPKDYDDAYQMLTSYLGKTHQVVTSVCLQTTTYQEIFYTYSNVKLIDKTDQSLQLIKQYIDTNQVYDKAGAYGIQDINPALIDYIEGDICTIIGLPVSQIYQKISKGQK